MNIISKFATKYSITSPKVEMEIQMLLKHSLNNVYVYYTSLFHGCYRFLDFTQ